MADLFDYLEWRGDLTFRQVPVTMVDNLLFSCLAYVVLQDIVGGLYNGEIKTIAESAMEFAALSEEAKNLRDKNDERIFYAMANTKRFGDLPLQYHVQQLDKAAEKQFAAITIALDDGSHFVAYRGTDYSVIGWKEDFNMTFCSGVPAQLEAVKYLNAVAERTTGPLYVGGHSKGGNLAIYAASFCTPEVQNRIVAIYNNDGPGFLEDVIASDGYQIIRARIQTYVPQASFFGLALEHEADYTVIESTERFLMQHDPYSWSVKGAEFVYLDEVTPGGKFWDQTMHDWLAGLSKEQRASFVDAVYEILAREDAKTLQETAKLWLNNTGELIQSVRNVDEETVAMIQHTLKLLGQTILQTAAAQVRAKERLKLPAVFTKHGKDTE